MELYTNNTRKPLPPYGKTVTQLAKHPAQITITCGDWLTIHNERVRHWNIKRLPACKLPAIVLPINKNPATYHWPVAGSSCYVLPGRIEPERYNTLAYALMKAGALDVLPGEHLNGYKLPVHKRELREVAA